MTKNMLIDAIHPEETRVVVTDHNQIQEFDFESQSKAPLRGNIYLAKVTRVEPSLQAAFVEYGGNRHGFLAFNEIHPDYYQIPVSDREELLKEQAAEDRSQAATDDNQADDNNGDDAAAETSEETEAEDKGDVSDIGGDAHEEAAPAINTRALHRKYKIQEVIKRRQIILIQVMKEERGNKGAALTTYLSLAGRYCVLMPNTARGGGISRKINNGADRKKLKTIVGKLDVADGMGLIVRTAGAQRTLMEIRRDFQYLTRMWEDIREKTVSSTAPTLVYEEGNLIRRCIRDLYSKDFDQVVIDGADSYKEAKTYMKLLMPSHARKVKQHSGDAPLFKEHGVEDKLAAMFNPTVVLPSGGYLVINPTEALVSIDVNSGKSTREQSVEKTALATNLEAAVEVARQARLRDLAGLLVIDFIDMDENRNNRAVERKMKEALKADRARIQVGRISSFGLMEMSRQRMRAGVLEGSSETCVHCNGSGMVRSVESRALHVLRQIDEDAGKFSEGELSVHLPQDVAIYLLNNKRSQLHEIESRTGVSISVEIDTELNAMEMSITLPDNSESSGRMEGDPSAAVSDENGGKRRRRRRGGRNRRRGQGAENGADEHDDDAPSAAEDSDNDAADADADMPADVAADGEDGDDEDKPKRRRRRGRRGGRNRRRSQDAASDGETEGDAETPAETANDAATEEDAAEGAEKDTAKPQKIIIEVAAEEAEEAEADDAAEGMAEDNQTETTEAESEVAPDEEAEADSKGKRKSGWWRK